MGCRFAGEDGLPRIGVPIQLHRIYRANPADTDELTADVLAHHA